MRTALRSVLTDRPIAYHPVLAQIAGSASAGILLSQLLYWDGVMSAKYPDWDGWFYKVADEIRTETGMTRSELETARKHLIARNLIACDIRQTPPKTFYRVNFEQIESLLDAWSDNALPPRREVTRGVKGQFAFQESQFAEIPQNEMPEDGNLICRNPANQFTETPQNELPEDGKILQEITPSITSADYQETTSDAVGVFLDPEGFENAVCAFEQELTTVLTPELRARFAELWDEIPDRKAHAGARYLVKTFGQRPPASQPTLLLRDYALHAHSVFGQLHGIPASSAPPRDHWARLGASP